MASSCGLGKHIFLLLPHCISFCSSRVAYGFFFQQESLIVHTHFSFCECASSVFPLLLFLQIPFLAFSHLFCDLLYCVVCCSNDPVPANLQCSFVSSDGASCSSFPFRVSASFFSFFLYAALSIGCLFFCLVFRARMATFLLCVFVFQILTFFRDLQFLNLPLCLLFSPLSCP